MSRERCPTCKRAMPKPLPRKRAKPRRGPMREPKYLVWCRRQYCAITYNDDGVIWHHAMNMDAAHTQNNGMSSKGPDSSCVPMCRYHHREYDCGRAAFEKKYGVSLQAKAKEYYAQFLKETEK